MGRRFPLYRRRVDGTAWSSEDCWTMHPWADPTYQPSNSIGLRHYFGGHTGCPLRYFWSEKWQKHNPKFKKVYTCSINENISMLHTCISYYFSSSIMHDEWTVLRFPSERLVRNGNPIHAFCWLLVEHWMYAIWYRSPDRRQGSKNKKKL